VEASVAPLWWYAVAALSPGTPLVLFGWRITRGFGTRGMAWFLVGVSLFGVTRDGLYAAFTGLIVFGAGLLPWLIDAVLGWGLGCALALLVMRVVAGPARADPLARA
jgi:hypothetical protein